MLFKTTETGSSKRTQGTVPVFTDKERGGRSIVKKVVSVICHLLIIALWLLAGYLQHKGIVKQNDPSGFPLSLAVTLLFFAISEITAKPWYRKVTKGIACLGVIACILLLFM